MFMFPNSSGSARHGESWNWNSIANGILCLLKHTLQGKHANLIQLSPLLILHVERSQLMYFGHLPRMPARPLPFKVSTQLEQFWGSPL